MQGFTPPAATAPVSSSDHQRIDASNETADDGATLMDQLDRRQNEVLQRLDDLDASIKQLMVTWQSQRAA